MDASCASDFSDGTCLGLSEAFIVVYKRAMIVNVAEERMMMERNDVEMAVAVWVRHRRGNRKWVRLPSTNLRSIQTITNLAPSSNSLVQEEASFNAYHRPLRISRVICCVMVL